MKNDKVLSVNNRVYCCAYEGHIAISQSKFGRCRIILTNIEQT